MKLAGLNGFNGMNGAGKGIEVAREGAKGKERVRGGGQEANIVQWVNTSDHKKEYTAGNIPKGKKATGAGTSASTSAILTSGLGGPGWSATTPLNLITSMSPTPPKNVSAGTYNFFSTMKIAPSVSTFIFTTSSNFQVFAALTSAWNSGSGGTPSPTLGNLAGPGSMSFAPPGVSKNIFSALSTSAPTPAHTMSTRTATKATATTTQLPAFADEDNNGSLLGKVDDADDLMVGIDMDLGSGAGHSSALTLATAPIAVMASAAAPLAALVTLVEDHYTALARSGHGPELRIRSRHCGYFQLRLYGLHL
jgi:hypothetical protein